MTEAEADKLKAGDRVLIEAVIDQRVWSIFDYNRVLIAIKGCNRFFDVDPEVIREKIAPPRWTFKAGDIVRRKHTNRLYTVAMDEKRDQYDIALWHGELPTDALVEEIELVCAVEDRKDSVEV